MELSHAFAGLAVRSDEAFAWYERLLGRPPDMRPRAGEVVWRLADCFSLYVCVDEPRAGGGLLTLAVADLAGPQVELGARAVDAELAPAGPGAQRRLVVLDPDGNRITLFEAPRAG